jgi:sugar-specific transcriptional regulator TrmB
MSDEDLRETVERVGAGFDLGEYEIEAYLAVLRHGELTASEVAERTDIPQPRVYDTVRSLGDRGLVELQESRPMKAVAIEPEEAFTDLRSNLTEMVAALEEAYTAPARETEAVSLVKSRSTILRYFEEVVADAEFELVCSLTPSLLDRFADDLAAAKDRGVSIDLVVTPSGDAPDPADFDYERVTTTARGRRGITTPLVAVADGQYSVYATQGAVSDDSEKYGVIFNRSALGFLVSGFFGTVVWSTANRVLHEPERTVELPRSYASIRRCVKDVQALDGDVYATVEGRDVLTADVRIDRGAVVETSLEHAESVASLVLETDDGPVDVGGRLAAYEDVEAHEITLARDAPPEV